MTAAVADDSYVLVPEAEKRRLFYSFVWVLLLLILVWPLAGLVLPFYVLLLPFEALEQPFGSTAQQANAFLVRYVHQLVRGLLQDAEKKRASSHHFLYC